MKRKTRAVRMPAVGVEITPDVWDRLEADRRQALEDDLSWIRRGRKETAR